MKERDRNKRIITERDERKKEILEIGIGRDKEKVSGNKERERERACVRER